MQRPKRLGHVALLNDDADVSLRRALGNGVDVDAVLSQGIEGTARKPRVMVHGIPHQSEDAEATLHTEWLHFAHLDVAFKFFVQGFQRLVDLVFLNRDRDAVF